MEMKVSGFVAYKEGAITPSIFGKLHHLPYPHHKSARLLSKKIFLTYLCTMVRLTKIRS